MEVEQAAGSLLLYIKMTLTPAFEAFLTRAASRLDPADSAGAPVRTDDRGSHAAVTLFLRPDRSGDSAEILLIKRARRAGDPWSGHLAFPGGRAEAEDATLLDVAVREAVEEVGIDPRAGGRLLGWLPSFHPLSGRNSLLAVAPLVALAPEGAVARPQPEEVETAFWVAVQELRAGGRSARVRFEMEGVVREWPAYPSPRGPIWGITERILSAFVELIDNNPGR